MSLEGFKTGDSAPKMPSLDAADIYRTLDHAIMQVASKLPNTAAQHLPDFGLSENRTDKPAEENNKPSDDPLRPTQNIYRLLNLTARCDRENNRPAFCRE